MSGRYPVSPTVLNACRSVAEGHLMPVVCTKSVGEVREALGSPDLFTCYRFRDGTILLVVPPQKSPVELLKERLEGLTPGQHRIALQRINTLFDGLESDTGDAARAKQWLAEGLRIRSAGWSVNAWIQLRDDGFIHEDNGRTHDPLTADFDWFSQDDSWVVVP